MQTNNTNKVIVHLGEKCWLATFIGPHAERIVRLMDTATLPLPFSASAPLAMVIKHMQVVLPVGVPVEHFA